MKFFVGVVFVLSLAPVQQAWGQQTPAASTYVSAADLKAVLAKAADRPVADLNARVVPAGPNDVNVNIARRTQEGMPADSGIAHRTLTEVYYVIEGAGMLITGGVLKDAEETGSGGANLRGKGIEGGETRRVSAGDVVVIPAGVPHAFSSIEHAIVYLNVRIEPAKR